MLPLPHAGEWAAAVEELPGLVALAPLEDAVEGVRVLLHGGRVHRVLHQLARVSQRLDFLVTLKIFCQNAAWGKHLLESRLLMLYWFCNGSNGSCSPSQSILIRFSQWCMSYLINFAWNKIFRENAGLAYFESLWRVYCWYSQSGDKVIFPA